MEKLSNQEFGSILTSEQFNQIPDEVQFVITSSGASLTSSLVQFAEALADYASRNNFYIGSGTANAQILTKQAQYPFLSSLEIGMEFHWRPTVANTGATTLNVAGKGVMDVKRESNGADLSANDLVTTKDARIRYDGAIFLLQGV